MSVKGLAEFYSTSERTIDKYRAKAAPLHDPVAFREWINKQPNPPEGVLTKLDELLGVDESTFPDEVTQDWKEFEAEVKADNPHDAMAKLRRARDWFAFQLERASKTKRKKDEKFYGDMLAKMEGTLHDAELRAKKLGIETGDLVRRADLEVPARFLAYHLLRCADTALALITAGLLERQAIRQLGAGDIQEVCESILLSACILDPIERASLGDNAGAPPAWLVKAMREGAAEVLEKPLAKAV